MVKIAIVCDFYYPSVGGVQIHIHYLASILAQRGHRVIIITHSYDKGGSHCDTVNTKQGFKVYYLSVAYSKATNVVYPNFIYKFSNARKILQEQSIQIVHTHQSTSALGLQFGVFASYLGLKVVHTQHSLFGYTSIYDIHLNATLGTIFKLYDHFIAVSRTTRNNLILRTNISPKRTTVIPNGVKVNIDRSLLQKTQKFNKDGLLHIVVLGRLVYRRGTDLLIQILPQLLKRNKNIKMHVIGDGQKMNALKKQVILMNLEKRVELLGSKPNSQALLYMAKCDIFLNTALTQSFGIALVEAALIGLMCVSTNVGSISEILPEEVLELVETNPNSIINGLQKTIRKIQKDTNQRICPKKRQTEKISLSQEIDQFAYDWQDCVDRTQQIYQSILTQHKKTRIKLVKLAIYQGFLKGNFVMLLFLFLMFVYWTMQVFSKLTKKTQDIKTKIK